MKPIDFSLQMASAKSLPYDSEVEWLESRRAQAIDTTVKIGPMTDFSFDLQEMKLHNYAYGVYRGTNKSVDYVRTGDRFLIRLGDVWIDNLNLGGSLHSFRHSHEGYDYIDNVEYKTAVSPQCEYPFFIFARPFNGSLIDFSTSRTSFFKASENGHDIVDMFAVRFTNENGVSEGAMYDRVSKQLFRNIGTGAFIIGPDVSSASQNFPPPQS